MCEFGSTQLSVELKGAVLELQHEGLSLGRAVPGSGTSCTGVFIAKLGFISIRK